MKPTLKQIAERTGCSISTVSRSLANSSSISHKTKAEVQRIAKELGYRPAEKKRAHRKKKRMPHFALLSEFRIGEFYASLFCGYRDASYREDVRLSLLSVKDQRSECVKFIQQVQRENKYDGIILFFPALERDHYEEILEVLPKGFPIVSNALINNPNLATVTFDGYSGGHLAAGHFHRRGYRRLGIIEGPATRPESRFRSNGFIDYVRQQPDLELSLRFDGDYEYETGVTAFRKLLQTVRTATGPASVLSDHERSDTKRPGAASTATPPATATLSGKLPVDAVFAANDSMAIGFMEAARSEGIRIPQDVAVLGYDNLPAGCHLHPGLSSIDTDFVELGVSSIKALKNKIRKQGYKHGTLSLIPVHLVERDSTSLPSPARP